MYTEQSLPSSKVTIVKTVAANSSSSSVGSAMKRELGETIIKKTLTQGNAKMIESFLSDVPTGKSIAPIPTGPQHYSSNYEISSVREGEASL